MAKKEDNARMLDPNRFKVAKDMAVMPGGPMNNNPMNVVNVDAGAGSLSGINQFPYGDSGLERDPSMGTNAVFPMQPSGNPQNAVIGTRLNAQAPYGYQQQPGSADADPMESVRLGTDAQNRQLFASPMGPIGMEAQPAPGGSVPGVQQSPGTIGLQGQQSAEVPTKGGTNMRSGKRS